MQKERGILSEVRSKEKGGISKTIYKLNEFVLKRSEGVLNCFKTVKMSVSKLSTEKGLRSELIKYRWKGWDQYTLGLKIMGGGRVGVRT